MKKDTSFTWRPGHSASALIRGKQVIIVGGTGGLGRAFAQNLAKHGASVTVVGQTFRDNDIKNIKFVKADLSRMTEAQRVAKELPVGTADILVFTTGIFAANERQVTSEGIERDMAVSYLNRLVMLREIAPRLGKSPPLNGGRPRIFSMAYPGGGQTGKLDDLNAEKSYNGINVHMNTVAGNEILLLQSIEAYPGIDFFGLNPGLIKTNIRSNMLGEGSLKFRIIESLIGLFSPTPEGYAERIVPLLVSPDLEGHSGKMFDKKATPILPSPITPDHRDRFIAQSEELIAKRAGVQVQAAGA